jgi:RNA polymerase sigma-70 factor (ECF subfamily)
MSEQGDLIEAAKAGSVLAFTELVHEYRDGLLRFLVTRSSSYADAEDALQDTLLSTFRYLDTYDRRWRFSTWLYRIAIRKLGKLSANETADVEALHDEGADPLRQCIARSEHENLWLATRRTLSDEVFTAMWLRYVEDLPLAEVARALERSMPWTKVTLMRSRRRLRAACADDAIGKKESEAYG